MPLGFDLPQEELTRYAGRNPRPADCSAPVGAGLMDTVCPPSTQYAAYNRISSKKHRLVYPDCKHEDLPGLRDRILEFMLGL